MIRQRKPVHCLIVRVCVLTCRWWRGPLPAPWCRPWACTRTWSSACPGAPRWSPGTWRSRRTKQSRGEALLLLHTEKVSPSGSCARPQPWSQCTSLRTPYPAPIRYLIHKASDVCDHNNVGCKSIAKKRIKKLDTLLKKGNSKSRIG